MNQRLIEILELLESNDFNISTTNAYGVWFIDLGVLSLRLKEIETITYIANRLNEDISIGIYFKESLLIRTNIPYKK